MNAVCMLTPSRTPNQIRSMPRCSATGPTSGTMMKAISKKSRKKARTKTRTLTTIRKPSWPPGSPVSRFSIQTWPSTPKKVRLKTREPMRMNSTKDDSLVVESSAWRTIVQLSRRLTRGQHQRADGAHGAALGGRGDADEDGAEHQEDEHQRRDQRDDHAHGELRCRIACGTPSAAPAQRPGKTS